MLSATPRRFYYGWVIVATTAITSFLAICSVLYGYGLFTLPVSREFGLTRSQFNTGITLIHIADALISPLVGWLVDRYSPRRVIMGGGLCLGLALATLGLSTSIALDILILAVFVPLGFISATSLSSYTLITRWFRIHRGRAMAIFALGSSLSGILGVPAIGSLIEYVGWRSTLLVMAGVVGLGIALLSLILVDAPRPGEVERGRASAHDEAAAASRDARAWTVRELMSSPRMWQYTVAASLAIGAITSIMLSIVPFGQQLGMTTVLASTLISGLSISSMVAKLGLAIVADRVERVVLLAISALLLSALCVVLLIKPSYPLLLAGCLLGGCSLGATFPLFAAIMADLFGSRTYGRVLGVAAPVMAVFNASAAKFVGIVHDRTGSYDIAFATYAVMGIIAGLLVLIRRPVHAKVPANGQPASASPM